MSRNAFVPNSVSDLPLWAQPTLPHNGTATSAAAASGNAMSRAHSDRARILALIEARGEEGQQGQGEMHVAVGAVF